MIGQTLTALTRPRTALGMAVTLLPEGKSRVDICVLRRHRDTVILVQQHRNLASLADITELDVAVDIPVYLAVLGRGILHKSFTGSEAPAEILSAADGKDFYHQQATTGEVMHASLVRQTTFDPLLTTLDKQGRYVKDACLGPFCFASLLPYLPGHPATYVAGGYEITVQNQQVGTVSPWQETLLSSDFMVEIGSEQIDSAMLIPYSGALAILSETRPVSLSVPDVHAAAQEWQQQQVFRKAGIVVLGIFFFALLLNFYAFSTLTEQNQQLTSLGFVNRQTLAAVDSLRRSVAQQRRFLDQAGWLERTRHSVWADQLAASVPPTLQLTVLDFTPLDQTQTTQLQRPVFIPGVIRVKGQCQEAQTLNAWLQRINGLPWVTSIREQNFTYDYSASTGTFTFSIHTASVPVSAL